MNFIHLLFTMSSQIVFTIADKKKKELFVKKLKSVGLNNKGFFMSCIDAYLDGKLQFGVQLDDAAMSYYDHPWFVEVNESIDDMLEKIRVSKKSK